VRIPGGATNGIARVRINIPGWDKIDLANPSFEIRESGHIKPLGQFRGYWNPGIQAHPWNRLGT
jgi:hypothetical protein